MSWSTVTLLSFALAAGACYSSGGETDDAGTDDTAGDEATRDDASAEDVVHDDAARDDGGCDTMCFVDFPCENASFCVSATRVQPCRTVSCLEACGTTCCSGATCWAEDPVECTGDTVCWELHEPGYGMGPRRTAECRPRPTEPPPPPLDGGADTEEDDGGTDGGLYDVWLPPGSYDPAAYCV